MCTLKCVEMLALACKLGTLIKLLTGLWQYRLLLSGIVCISQLPDCLHVGNKCDLEQERQVPFEKACNLAKESDVLAALETSAKVMSILTCVKHRGVGKKGYLKSSVSSSVSPSLCLGESECGRSFHLDGQRADVS